MKVENGITTFDNVEDAKKFLVDYFDENGYDTPIEIETNHGPIKITACFDDMDKYKTAKSISEIDFYLVDGPLPWMGGDDIDRVSEELANIDSLIEKNVAAKHRLFQFYDETLAATPEKDLELMRNVSDALFEDFYDNNPDKLSLDKMFESKISTYASKFGVSYGTIHRMGLLQQDCSFYSDWHKDLYGFRPQSIIAEPGTYVDMYNNVVEDSDYVNYEKALYENDDFPSDNLWSNNWQDPKWEMREYDYSDEIDDDIYYYYESKYTVDDSTYIGMMMYSYEDDMWLPADDVTVNLSGYNMSTGSDDKVFIPTYNLTEDSQFKIRRDLVKEVIREVPIGYGNGYEVELRDDWHEYLKKSQTIAENRVEAMKEWAVADNRVHWTVFDNISNKNISDVKTDKFGHDYRFVRMFDNGQAVSMIVPPGYIKDKGNGRTSTMVIPDSITEIPFKGVNDGKFSPKAVDDIYHDIYVPQQKSIENFKKANQSQSETDTPTAEDESSLEME